MVRDDSDPYAASVFLASWALEVRAGYTPADELDVALRLIEDYLDPEVPPEVEARLVTEVTRESARLIGEARADEATWTWPTMNDRISAAFADLREKGIVAKECAGLTLQDGWGYVGLDAAPGSVGAVFFHQQDVFDALHGESLLVAFGGASTRAEERASARAVATAALDTLAAHGVPAAWTGRVEDRLEIAPFAWQHRRWSAAPGHTAGATTPWRTRPTARGLVSITAAEVERFVQPTVARRTCHAIDAMLSLRMRQAWRSLGGERGQIGHLGDPHVFVRAGEQTVLIPVDALRNLDPGEAASLRRRAMVSRGPVGEAMPDPGQQWHAEVDVQREDRRAAPKEASRRPWWKIW